MYEEQKEVLLSMRNQLIKELVGNLRMDLEYTRCKEGDIIDIAEVELGRGITMMLCDRDKRKLLEIDEALKSIENGTYGICRNCENRIRINRLRAIPFTQFCVTCKSEIEKNERKVNNYRSGVMFSNFPKTEYESTDDE